MTLGIIPDTHYKAPVPASDTTGGMSAERLACYADPNCDVTTGLIQLLRDDLTQTGAGWVSDASGNPAANSIPSWVWYAGAGLLGFIALSGLRR